MKAIIKVDVPEFQIGQEVTVYYRDTMCIKGVCEKEEERKKGRWEFVSYGDGIGNYHCSECRAIADSYYVGNLANRHWEYNLTRYCPNCGAEMEGE